MLDNIDVLTRDVRVADQPRRDYDLVRRAVQFLQFLNAERQVRRAQVFFQAVQFGGAGDGHDPRFLR